MATFELPKPAVLNSTEYADTQNPYGVAIISVSNGKSGSVLSVGDMVTATYVGATVGTEVTISATFIGTMSVTVSGEVRVFMVLESSDSGITYHTVIGLNRANAPSDIVKTGNSANITEESFTVCFFPGTLIATPSGERKVEELVPGDMVLLGDSGAIPTRWLGRKFARAVSVKWIGWQTVSTLFGTAERLMPVRFAAGSLGGGNPFNRIAI